MKPYLSVHWPFHLGQVKIFSLASKFISRHKDFPTFSAWRTPRIITSRHFHLKRGRPSVNFYNNQKQVLFISYNVMQTLLTYLNWQMGLHRWTVQADSCSLLYGFATRFVLTTTMENGSHFTGGQVDQLCRLGGSSVNSVVVHLYVKKIIERYSDSAGLITPGRYMSLKLHMRIRERYGLW